VTSNVAAIFANLVVLYR